MSSAPAMRKLKPSDLPAPTPTVLACASDEVDNNQPAMKLEGTEQPLGILPNYCFSFSEPISLQGASLYLYSDGVTEAKSADGKMLETNGLIHLLQQHRYKLPRQRLQAVVDPIGTPQHLYDDIILLMIDGDQS